MNPTRVSKCPACQSKKIVHPSTGKIALHCYTCGFERWKAVPQPILQKA